MKATIEGALIGRSLFRAVTAEQINQNQGAGQLVRAAEIPAGSIDEEARTVELAFSSEAPVMRWFGEEVLDHSRDAVVMTRLEAGAALLLDHNSREQIGVVESARIDADRVGRAVVRFSRSARGEEIWQDVRDGIRRHVSVGYSAVDVKVEKREGQPDLVTLTRWEPFEISIVSVPADVSVGVGRSQGETPEEGAGSGSDTRNQIEVTRDEVTGMERILRNAAGDLVRAKVDENGNIIEELEVLERASETQALVQRGTQAEQTRTADLLELGEQYSAQQLAAEAIRGGETVDAFTRRLLEHVNGRRSERQNRPLNDNGGEIGMSDGEVRRFSFLRAFRALIDPTNQAAQRAAAFEFEASRAAQEATGRDAQGIMVPADVLTRALNTATSETAAGDSGGNLVATDLLASSFIDLLRNRSVALRLATPLNGLVGNVDVPRQASGATGYWMLEDADATESVLEVDQVSLSPKTVGGYSEITRRMLMQSSLDAEALVRRDLAAALGLTVDKAVFYGTGSGAQPQGLSTLSGINAVDFATAAQPTYAEHVKMETEISSDNADVASMAYVGNAGWRGHCKSTEKFSGTSGQPIWEPGNTVNGYRAEVSNQVASGDVFFGNWADLLIGMWGGLDLVVDPYTNSKKGRVRIVAMQDVDFAHRHVESFCYGVLVP